MRTHQARIGLSLALITTGAAWAGSPFAPIALEYLYNGGVSDASGANLQSSVTYDVSVHNITGRDIRGIIGFDFGSQNGLSHPLLGIPINGSIFNHDLGADTIPEESLVPAFPALRFDTYWAIGDQPVDFEPGSVDLDAKDAMLNARFTFAGPPVDLAVGEFLRVGRLTFLDGNFDYERPFGFAAILNDGTRVMFGVPSPNACVTIVFASLCAAHRRRR